MKASTGIAARASSLLSPTVAVALVIVAVALDSGGYGGVPLGIGAAAVWLGAIVVAFGTGRVRLIDRWFAAAALILAALTVMTAVSLGWSLDDGSGFADVVRLGAYLGAFVLTGLLLRAGAGRSVLEGVGAGLVAVSVIALASRLLDLGAGDTALVAATPSFAGRLSYPIGYWNALGAMAAMAAPVLIWIASDFRGRVGLALALAGIPVVVLAAYLTSSRGALIAAVIGAGIVIAAAESRSRALAGLAVGALAATPAVLVATVATGITDSPGTTPGGPEAAVCLALAVGIAFAFVAGPRLVSRSDAIRVHGLRMRHVLAAALAVLVALVLLVGPGRIAGDFAATSGREATAGGAQLSVTGSGRAQFWSTALDAFAAEPLRGIGSGSFAFYWNRNGSLETPVKNAHSEPLELLAELGPLGLAAFVAFFVAVAIPGIRRARAPGGAAAGAALGLIATGLVGIVIDWTWDVPAVALPILVAGAVLSTRALDPGSPGDGGEPVATASSARWLSVPAGVVALLVVVAAIPVIWAGGVLAVATNRLEASDDALAAGRLDDAAAAARTAAALEPWSAEPWLRLATIEQAAGNLEAARLDAARAIELTPKDFRPWLLASGLESKLGNEKVLIAYAAKALALAPLVIPRAALDSGVGLGPGS
ncbi:MAG TPA: O-antigen ligase family protein [Solirubrobacterales bacterium]|nr:O-antigen ligase family protein [Solirubrobacterales bacterium]